MTVGLPDEGHRERIRNDLETRFVVDAGAGSGKTLSLIERIVSLVGRGTRMGSLAAITFTEAAAAELRVRIRQRLEELAAGDERFAVAAREADDAAVCTIHAFALRILSEHWLEAGLPPAVEVLDAAGDHLDHARRWRELFDGLLEDPVAMTVLVRAIAAGLRVRTLSEVARWLGDHHELLTPSVLGRLETERARRAGATLDVGGVIAPLGAAVAMEKRCRDTDDRLRRHLTDRCSAALRRLQEARGEDDPTVISTLRSVGKLDGKGKGKGPAWGPCIGQVRALCDQAEERRRQILDEVVGDAVVELTARICRWVLAGADHRREQGRLTYHDLLVEAVRLLSDHDEVRRAVRSRYRFLFIDEFQDTDPLQARLAQLLGSAEVPSELARLFVVGDPEQSIYRFRGADVGHFAAMAEALDERLELTANFRSVPAILSFVDDVFAHLADEMGGPFGVAHRSLQAVRSGEPSAQGPAVAVFGRPDDRGRAKDVRLRSAGQVASVIGRIHAEGWSVETDDGPRPVRYRDIAVLLPTRTSLPVLERAFEEADIPYRLEGATLVWGSQDVRDLLAVLRAVAHPADPLAVLGALRTPALACGDDDLLRYRHAGGSWDPRAGAPDVLSPQDPVARAMRVLAAFHAQRMWHETSGLVAAVLEELHLFELALVHRRPRDHWHRLRWVLDQARAFDDAGGATLAEFLDWVDATEEAEPWSSSLGPPDPDDEAIRVMTVHGAKGLEFPVVVVSGLDTVPPGEPSRVLFDGAGVPRVRFSADFEASEHKSLAVADKARDQAERLRLLYVALTRARDHLVLDLNHKQTGTGKSLAAKVFQALEHGWPAEVLDDRPDVGPPPVGEAAGPTTGPSDPAWWEEHRHWWEGRRRLLEERRRQPAWSATALAKAGSPAPTPAHRGAGAPDAETQRRIGRAVHDALSKVDLPRSGVATDAHLAVAAASAESQHLTGADAALVAALFSSALGAPIVRAIAANRHWKELPLAVPLPGGAVLEGFADLVGESDDGLVVVDFKTAPPGPAIGQYVRQVAAYAYALGVATGRPVARVAVLSLDPSGPSEESLAGPALDEAIGRLLAAARG